MSKREADFLIARIRELDVSLLSDPHSDEFAKLKDQLAAVNFEVKSSCGNFTAWFLANGKLDDVAIADGALDNLDQNQLETAVTQTIRRGEEIVWKALGALREAQTRQQQQG